jgi:hypothetical protein
MPDTWHGQIGFGLAGFWMFMLHSVGLSLLMTWVYLNTNRSILSGMFMHFTSNFTGQLLAPVSEQVDLFKSVLMVVIGLAVCLMLSRKNQAVLRMNTPKVKTS